MKYEWTINNYTLGARLRMCPVHKITKQERISPKATLIEFSELTQREIEFINKVLARKGIRKEG